MRVMTATTQSKTAHSGAWAARLAKCRNFQTTVPQAPDPTELLEDMDALFTLFDDARIEANSALAEAGLTESIDMRDTGIERRYSLLDPDGEERSISISMALRGMDGHVNGGAFIGLTRTRLSIYVVPETRGDHVRWLTADGSEFAATMVHDLFLSVFGDDAAATFRLSPLAGTDLFQTPWS